MPKPADSDKVNVVVHERPNKVWVEVNGEWHSARWRTADNGDGLRDVKGNVGLVNAALLAWDGQEAYTTTFGELVKRSGGWGAWTE